MKPTRHMLLSGIIVAAVLSGAPSAQAQQITGTPGSPSATTTIDGRNIPNPPAPFAGKVNLSYCGLQTRLASRPWCRPKARPTCC